MYEDFLEEMDEWFDPAGPDFASADDVAALRARFRVPSPILDDTRCRELRAGSLLCVACALPAGDLMYYDAVLDSVMPVAHGTTVDDEDRCACRFSVRWAGGPRAGGFAEVGVEKICRVETAPPQDPVLDEFFDGVMAKWLGERNAEVEPATGGEGEATPGQADLK